MPKSRSLPLRLTDQHNGAVSAQEIDQYLDALEEPKRATLARLRQTILKVLPEADQGISYGVPAFKVRGKAIAGFAAFKNHLSYLPHSGSVFPRLHDELEGYTASSGALRFGIDEPLPGAAGREADRGAAPAGLSCLTGRTQPPVRKPSPAAATDAPDHRCLRSTTHSGHSVGLPLVTAATCVLPPASASYIVWLDSRADGAVRRV